MNDIEELLKKEFWLTCERFENEIHIKLKEFDTYVLEELEKHGDYEELENNLMSIIDEIRENFDVDVDYTLELDKVILQII